jgi:hypothetical protein
MNCSVCNLEISSPKLTGELCTSCFFRKPKPESKLESKPEPESKPAVKEPIKICQSCLERFGKTNILATREWTEGYFICDDCFEPLVNSIASYNGGRNEELIREIKGDTNNKNRPMLAVLYDILQVPTHLQFDKADLILTNRNEIFNHHAVSLQNQSLSEVTALIEELRVMAFQINIMLEERTHYINKIKQLEREKSQLTGTEASRKEFSKGRIKTSKDEKLAKTLGMNLEQYGEMIKKMKQKEFDKLTGNS